MKNGRMFAILDGYKNQTFYDEHPVAASAERSCFESGITPAVTDKVVTLSTCSYEFNNARFVLVGILK